MDSSISPPTKLEDHNIIPSQYALYQNYPNPFNPGTILRFDLSKTASVQIVIYDIFGREFVLLVDQEMEPGYHEICWNGKMRAGQELPSGTYIARLVTPAFSKSIKMVLLR